MRDSTDDRSDPDPNGADLIPPHPEDLRNVILNRSRQPTEAIGTGDFSAEDKSENEPVWTDAQSDPIENQDAEWQETASVEPQPHVDREFQRPPFYTEFEAETDRGHPGTVARFGPPAGFGRRVLAYLIDNAVTIVILSLLFPFILGRPYVDVDAITAEFEAASQQALPTATPVLGANGEASQVAGSRTDNQEPQSVFDVFSGLLLAFAVTTIYNGMLVGLFGTTIGKRLLNVYILDQNGNIPGIPLAFGRALATIVSTAIFYIGYLFILRNDNRALHDLMVGTYAITLTSGEQPAHRQQQHAD